jgi:hypothetical protein
MVDLAGNDGTGKAMPHTRTTPSRNVLRLLTREPRVSLGSYPTYAEAQRVVDHLADHEFEVQATQIVGTDLRMVPPVAGELTWPPVIVCGETGAPSGGSGRGTVLPTQFEVIVLAAQADLARSLLTSIAA